MFIFSSFRTLGSVSFKFYFFPKNYVAKTDFFSSIKFIQILRFSKFEISKSSQFYLVTNKAYLFVALLFIKNGCKYWRILFRINFHFSLWRQFYKICNFFSHEKFLIYGVTETHFL